jgi:hypothetical protein
MARLSPKIPADLDHLPDCYATTHDLVENVKIIQKFQDISSKLSGQLMHVHDTPTLTDMLFMKNSWQLTSIGAAIMSMIFKRWECAHDENAVMTGRVLLGMSKAIKVPWYNRGRHVYIWNEGIHFELQLLEGSLRRFIEFRQPK